MGKNSKNGNGGKKVGAYKQVGKMYSKALGYIRSKQVVTRSMVEKFYSDAGKKESASVASATVLLSPRKEDSARGKFGNCLGNFSADGVNYYMVPLKHVKGEEKRFRFHLCTADEVKARQAIDEKRGNGRKAKEVKQVKTVKASKVAKTVKKVKKTVKAKAKKVAKVVKVEIPAATVPAVPTPASTVETPAAVETPVAPVETVPAV